MRILLFGGTGMIGHGVLQACRLDKDVHEVVAVVRAPSGLEEKRVREIVLPEVRGISSIAGQLTGFSACFFCLGQSAVGMTELSYSAITYNLTVAVAQAILPRNPAMTFIYVSGAGTDRTEEGRVMWARVKGRTENALLNMPFRAVFMFRPGFIQPLSGARSKTRWYRWIYAAASPLFPLLRELFPRYIVNTEEVGRAMIIVAKSGYPRPILEAPDIASLARG